MRLLRTFISAYKDSARRAKYQIYWNISESQPIFNLQKQVKISANRTKKQVYLHFSEVLPNFNLQKQVKDSEGERNTKFQRAKVEKMLVFSLLSKVRFNYIYLTITFFPFRMYNPFKGCFTGLPKRS